jgi:hypothetical protein
VRFVSFGLPKSCEDSVKEAITEVLASHPLDEAGVLQHNLTMAIEPDPNWPSLGLAIGKGYPHIVLTVGTDKYLDGGVLKTEEFTRDLYHEFTHVIDRQNATFAITPDKEARAATLTVRGFNLVVDVWNVTINGRLHRRGIDIQSAEEFKQERLGTLLSRGILSPDDLGPIDEAWNLEEPTYDEVVGLASLVKAALDKCLRHPSIRC